MFLQLFRKTTKLCIFIEDRKASVTSDEMFNYKVDREVIYTPDYSELEDLMSLESKDEMFTVQQMKPICEDKSIWTGEVDVHHRFGIRIYSSSQICKNQKGDIKYTIEFGNQKVSTSQSSKSSLSIIQDNGNNLELKSNLLNDLKKSNNLPKTSRRRPKKLKFFDEKFPKESTDGPGKNKVGKIDVKNFQEVILDVDDEEKEQIKISISDNDKILGCTNLDWKTLTLSEILTKNISNNFIEDFEEFENQMKESEIINLPIQGRNLLIKSLPITVYWIKEKNSKFVEKSSNTENIEKLIHNLTGINLQKTSKTEIQKLLEQKEKVNSSTSPIPMNNSENIVIVVSFMKNKYQVVRNFEIQETQDTYIAEEEMIKMRDQHQKELNEIHKDYENKLKKILDQLHQLQRDASIQRVIIHKKIIFLIFIFRKFKLINIMKLKTKLKQLM